MDENIVGNTVVLQNMLDIRPLERQNQKEINEPKLFRELKSKVAEKRCNSNNYCESPPIKRYNSFKSRLRSNNLISCENGMTVKDVPDYLVNIRQHQEYQSYITCCESMTIESIDMLLIKDLKNAEQRENYFFNKHTDILPEYRYLVLDWIQEICAMYKFHRETYYLTMAYFDIYVSKCPANSILKEELQLVALSSLMMATKVEEINFLPMEDVLFLCDNIYTVKQVIHTEKSISEVLNWKCYPNTPNLWLLRFIHILNKPISEKEYFVCTRLLDVATFDLKYLKFPTSIIAATCIKLVISEDIFPVSSVSRFRLKLNKCVHWLRKYWQEINSLDNWVPSEICNNYKNRNEKCLRFPHLSFIQSYYSNIDIFKKLRQS